jgi:hypothetical protein
LILGREGLKVCKVPFPRRTVFAPRFKAKDGGWLKGESGGAGSPRAKYPENPKLKLVDQVREVMRLSLDPLKRITTSKRPGCAFFWFGRQAVFS